MRFQKMKLQKLATVYFGIAAARFAAKCASLFFPLQYNKHKFLVGNGFFGFPIHNGRSQIEFSTCEEIEERHIHEKILIVCQKQREYVSRSKKDLCGISPAVHKKWSEENEKCPNC